MWRWLQRPWGVAAAIAAVLAVTVVAAAIAAWAFNPRRPFKETIVSYEQLREDPFISNLPAGLTDVQISEFDDSEADSPVAAHVVRMTATAPRRSPADLAKAFVTSSRQRGGRPKVKRNDQDLACEWTVFHQKTVREGLPEPFTTATVLGSVCINSGGAAGSRIEATVAEIE